MNLLYMVFICRYFYKQMVVCDLCTVVFFYYKEESISQDVLVAANKLWPGMTAVHSAGVFTGLPMWLVAVCLFKSAEMFLSHFR